MQLLYHSTSVWHTETEKSLQQYCNHLSSGENGQNICWLHCVLHPGEWV